LRDKDGGLPNCKETYTLRRTAAGFRAHVAALDVMLPLDAALLRSSRFRHRATFGYIARNYAA